MWRRPTCWSSPRPAPLTVNTSRMVYLEANAAILAPLLDRLPAGWGGTVIVVTNPVDPLCTWAARRTGLDRTRLLGYTLNDSLRLRTGIGRRWGSRRARERVGNRRARGSGGAAVGPVAVDGRAVALDDGQRESGRSSSAGGTSATSPWTRAVSVDLTSGSASPGWCARASIPGDELWPASVMLEGEYGVDGVSLSVPVTLGGGAVRQITEWELSESEREALLAGARFVRDAAAVSVEDCRHRRDRRKRQRRQRWGPRAPANVL